MLVSHTVYHSHRPMFVAIYLMTINFNIFSKLHSTDIICTMCSCQ